MDAGEKFAFIDTRNPQAWAESETMLPGAIRLPVAEVEGKLQSVPKDKPVVTYCT